MIDSINAKWNFISKLVKIFGAEEERTCWRNWFYYEFLGLHIDPFLIIFLFNWQLARSLPLTFVSVIQFCIRQFFLNSAFNSKEIYSYSNNVIFVVLLIDGCREQENIFGYSFEIYLELCLGVLINLEVGDWLPKSSGCIGHLFGL